MYDERGLRNVPRQEAQQPSRAPMAHRYVPPGQDEDEQDLRDVLGPSYHGPQESDLDRPEGDDGGGHWVRRAGMVALVLAGLGLVMSMFGPLMSGGGGGGQAQPALPPGFEQATVESVIDGTTIVVRTGGREATVRYIGVAAAVPGEALFTLAQLANETWVTDREVVLERDAQDTDTGGRLLRYVYLDGVMVNAALIGNGFARHEPQPPNGRHDEVLAGVEDAAREDGRGIWGELTLQ